MIYLKLVFIKKYLNKMESIIHTANSRGAANFGWLDSKHTFSFGRYYNPERVHFGALRVLNDDIVQGGMGFGTHPHDNMEIVSIPLQGDLEHQDSAGNTEVIKSGDIQIMSAGTGLTHSEYNHSKTNKVNFLQLWVLPKKQNITPRYEQKSFPLTNRKNKLTTVVSPSDPQAVWINQDAAFTLGHLDEGKKLTYDIQFSGNGVYVFVTEGAGDVNGLILDQRDGAGFESVDQINILAKKEMQLLIVEVPMVRLG
ncbi:MAG: redox-sensitive bicupin YhaK (pirin superfamily) [Cyclobacteriaceae bacterium]